MDANETTGGGKLRPYACSCSCSWRVHVIVLETVASEWAAHGQTPPYPSPGGEGSSVSAWVHVRVVVARDRARNGRERGPSELDDLPLAVVGDDAIGLGGRLDTDAVTR